MSNSISQDEKDLVHKFLKCPRYTDAVIIQKDIIEDPNNTLRSINDLANFWNYFRLNDSKAIGLYPNNKHLKLNVSPDWIDLHYTLYNQLKRIFNVLLEIKSGRINFYLYPIGRKIFRYGILKKNNKFLLTNTEIDDESLFNEINSQANEYLRSKNYRGPLLIIEIISCEESQLEHFFYI